MDARLRWAGVHNNCNLTETDNWKRKTLTETETEKIKTEITLPTMLLCQKTHFYRASAHWRARDIDIAILSVRISVHDVPVLDENGLTYCHSFSTVR